MARSRKLAMLTAALLLLLAMGANVHIHEFDAGGGCRLCNDVPGPELPPNALRLAVPVVPDRAALACSAPAADAHAIATTVRRRGPPAP